MLLMLLLSLSRELYITRSPTKNVSGKVLKSLHEYKKQIAACIQNIEERTSASRRSMYVFLGVTSGIL